MLKVLYGITDANKDPLFLRTLYNKVQLTLGNALHITN